MHLSQETFDQIASLLQTDAKQFRRRKLTESIAFKKTDLGYAITLDNMGIGKLSIKDNQFAFSSHSALGERFNDTLFESLEECQASIVSHMMGDKPETEQLDEEADELEEAVKVSHDRYVRSTGKKATGSGNWMFTHKKMGDVNWKDEKDFFNARGSLAAASKEAKEWAKKHGYSVVYVMEEVEELDETAYEKGMDPKKKVVVQGVKGMKSRPFKKTFRNEAAYDKWADSPAAEDVTVHRVYQEAVELDEAGERLGVKSAQFDKLGAWEGRAKAKGFKVTKNNKSGTYYAWNGTKVVGTFQAHGKHFGGSLKEEVEEIDEANTTPFFYKDMKTKTPMKPADEIKALQDYIKDARRESGSSSNQRLYIATQRLQYLNARVVKEETEELDEGVGQKFPKTDLKGWKAQAEKMGLRIRAAVDADGDSGKRWTASDKNGNLRGEFHVNTGGKLQDGKGMYKEEIDKDESDDKKDKKISDKKGKKKDGEEMDMDPKAVKESFKDIVARLKEDHLNETKIKRLDTVHAKSLNITGMVYSIKGSKVQIRTPNKMVTADIKDLEVVDMDEEKTALGEDHLGGRKDGYPLYHPSYSAAVQEALKWAQRKGFKVNEDDYFNKVSTGPRKPTPGKTVSHSLALDNNKRKQLHLQVYNTGNSFELNCYVS